jgi:hypothetical protein
MDMMYLMGWYYQEDEGEDQAREFFETLRRNRAPFPFPCTYQVGLLRCDEEEHWAIGIQVMRGTAHDDSLEVMEALEKWFLESGADTAGSDKRVVRTTSSTIDATLHNQFGSYYTSIETFGSDGNAG